MALRSKFIADSGNIYDNIACFMMIFHIKLKKQQLFPFWLICIFRKRKHSIYISLCLNPITRIFFYDFLIIAEWQRGIP